MADDTRGNAGHIRLSLSLTESRYSIDREFHGLLLAHHERIQNLDIENIRTTGLFAYTLSNLVSLSKQRPFASLQIISIHKSVPISLDDAKSIVEFVLEVTKNAKKFRLLLIKNVAISWEAMEYLKSSRYSKNDSKVNVEYSLAIPIIRFDSCRWVDFRNTLPGESLQTFTINVIADSAAAHENIQLTIYGGEISMQRANEIINVLEHTIGSTKDWKLQQLLLRGVRMSAEVVEYFQSKTTLYGVCSTSADDSDKNNNNSHDNNGNELKIGRLGMSNCRLLSNNIPSGALSLSITECKYENFKIGRTDAIFLSKVTQHAIATYPMIWQIRVKNCDISVGALHYLLSPILDSISKSETNNNDSKQMPSSVLMDNCTFSSLSSQENNNKSTQQIEWSMKDNLIIRPRPGFFSEYTSHFFMQLLIKCSLLFKSRHLQLQLQNNTILQGGMKFIAEYLNQTNLKLLGLSNTGMTDEVLRCLATTHALQSNKVLTHLDLSQNPRITNESLVVLLSLLQNYNMTLQYICLDDCRQLSNKMMIDMIKFYLRLNRSGRAKIIKNHKYMTPELLSMIIKKPSFNDHPTLIYWLLSTFPDVLKFEKNQARN